MASIPSIIEATLKDVLAYNSRGDAYLNLKDHKKAIEDFSQAIRLAPDSSIAFRNRGLAYISLKNWNDACRDYRKACELGDCRFYKYYKQNGYCNSQSTAGGTSSSAPAPEPMPPEDDEAITQEHLDRIRQVHPDFEKYRDNGSIKAWIQKQPVKLRDSLQKTYNEGDIDSVIGLLNNFKKANNIPLLVPVPTPRKGTGKDTSRLPPAVNWYNKAEALWADGKYREPEKAIEYLNEALRISPEYFDAWLGLGHAYQAVKRYDDAIAAYRQAIHIKPEHAGIWSSLGLAYGTLKRHSDAIDAHKQAVRINPEHFMAWVSIGIAYYNLKRYDETIDACRQAIRINPNYSTAWFYLGNAYYHSGNRTAALGAVKELRRLDPEQADVLSKLIDKNQSTSNGSSDVRLQENGWIRIVEFSDRVDTYGGRILVGYVEFLKYCKASQKEDYSFRIGKARTEEEIGRSFRDSLNDPARYRCDYRTTVFVTFYTANGVEIETKDDIPMVLPEKDKPGKSEVLPGEKKFLLFPIPSGATSWKVWVPR